MLKMKLLDQIEMTKFKDFFEVSNKWQQKPKANFEPDGFKPKAINSQLSTIKE